MPAKGFHVLVVDLKVDPENPLYEGLGVSLVGGRANLPNATSADTLNAVGQAVKALVDALPATERDVVVLTGPAPVQVYLVTFHVVVHSFSSVRYRDGRGGDCSVAQHG